MNSNERNKTLDGWQASAPYWDKYRTVIEQIFAPLTAGLIEEAQISMGQKVLDIGGGSGEPSLTIAGIVGPAGFVIYTDPAAGMVASAKAEASRRGLTNIEFKQCSADGLPIADDSFDVVVGRLSAMFFPEPVTAVREALRVVREDGRLSLAVWAPKEANPFFSTTADVIEKFVEVPPLALDAPDPFRFAVAGKLVAVLETAGAQDVIERQLDFQIKGEMSFEQFWQLRTEMSESLRERLAGLTPDQIFSIKQAASDSARRYFENGRMNFPARALIVTGSKSSQKSR